MKRRSEGGFALLAVLWIMTGVAVLGLGLSLTARSAVSAARNRMELMRAGWHAEDCVERVRTVIAAALQADGVRSGPSGAPWPRLDEIVMSSALAMQCPGVIRFEPVGMAVDLNETTGDALRRLLVGQRMPPVQVDSLVDALLDWRDDDDTPRAYGAEREWYEGAGRSPPRNGRFAHLDELLRVKGFESRTGAFDSARDSLGRLFTVEPGRILLEHASVAVLASLPGITEETIGRLVERRQRGAPPLIDVLALGGELSVASRDSLHRHYADLIQLITLEPDAWMLTVRSPGSNGTGPVVTIETRLVRAGARAAVVRRRMWP